MIKQPRKFSSQEKDMVALAAIKGEKTIAQISSSYQVHPTQIGHWKKQALDSLPEVFKDNKKKERLQELERQNELDSLYKVIGQRDIELDWLKKNCQCLTRSELQSLIDKHNQNINLTRQAELLRISRASLYYRPA